MSAKIAAAALVRHDPDIAERLKAFAQRRKVNVFSVRHHEYEDFAAYLYGRWTVSLAAEAAGVTEEQVIWAVLTYHARAGTSIVCRGIAKTMRRA